MSDITAIAPKKPSGEAPEFIEALWDAFGENYRAFKTGKMKLKDEIKYTLFSAPGPKQYEAFSNFFGFFKGEEKQVWKIWENNKNYMYTHNFIELDKQQSEPGILEFLRNLCSPAYVPDNDKPVTMVSGSFWRKHFPTREKIVLLFEELRGKTANLRICTCADWNEPYISDLVSLLDQKTSHFNISRRISIHFVLAYPYLYYEFPHTESSALRLNMLLDLDDMEYKKGKTKEQLLGYLDNLIKEAL